MAAVSVARRIALRDMTLADVPAVRKIESAAYSDAWPARVFESELQNGFACYRAAVERGDAPPAGRLASLWRRVAPPRERIVGFSGVWYMVDQLHLVTIAVAPDLQGRGIGQRLLLDVFDLAIEADLLSIVLEVRVSNTRAQRLYEHFGFGRIGTLRQYYRDNQEDAYVMQTGDLASEPMRARLDTLRAEHHARGGEMFED